MRCRRFPWLPHFWPQAGMLAAAFFLATLATNAAPPSPPSPSLSPGDADGWDTDFNLPSSTVTSIEQTPDGYLWVGTYNGLARFDGERFVTFDPVNRPELGQAARVQGLYLDASGTLWITTYRGALATYRHGVFHQELPDQSTFDLHLTMVSATSNEVTFVTQYGEVFQRAVGQPDAAWKITQPPTGSGQLLFQCVDAQNQLWFLTGDHDILRYGDDGFKPLTEDGGLAGSEINTVVADAQGTVWAGAENEIARWDGNQFQAMTPTNGEADIEPRELIPMRNGTLWVLDGDRLRKMSGRLWVDEATEWRGLLGPASGRGTGAHEDRDGGLWLNHYGNGLFHIFPDGHRARFTVRENLPSDRVGAWFQSSDGGIWAGMDHGGLARLRERRFHVIGTEEGLGARTALSVCEDKAGTMWIGTAGGGLCQLTNGVVTQYPVGASASANFIFSISTRPDGGAWLSAAEGEDLYQFHEGEVRRVSWDVHGIKSILTDHQGRVWMGTKYGIGFMSSSGTERRMLGTNDNASLPAVRALAETPDGQVWAGADDGTLFRCSPDGLTPFRPQDALAEQPIYSMIADADGTIWAGTFQGGLLRFKNGKFSRITTRQGLPLLVMSQILDDGHGRLWVGTHQGIYCFRKSALNACADGGTNMLDYVTYGRHDGMASVECSDGYQPACWRGSDGRLWFCTVRGGVEWVNPSDSTTKSVPPPVIIEELTVDDEMISPAVLQTGRVVIPPGHKELDFRYTALSFEAGDKARFRYRVDGLDTKWVDADTRRTLQLRNLPPREYRLRVIACNAEGVWNEQGASLVFVIQPFFYQTLTFRVLAGAAIMAAVALAVRRAATRKYRRKLAQMEQQHAIERDRARIAKDIHDDVGAGLTQITLLTELARREPDQTGANLERISDSARTLTKAMDEIVWAVDPQHDTLIGLMDYISAYAEDFLRVAGVRCRMDLPVALPEARVEAELRYNLFLALKEALNNVVKHAKATEVWLRLKVDQKSFTLVVEDNGRGLAAGTEASSASTDRLNSGSGLENMKKRLENVGGRCEIHSDPGHGTRVEMTARLAPVSPVMAMGTNGDMR